MVATHRRPGVPAAAKASLMLLAIAMPFAGAGTFRWARAWASLAAMTIGLLAHRAYVARSNQELVAARARIGAGTKRWDRLWLSVFWPLVAAEMVVAGMDVVRFHEAALPVWTFALGSAVLVAGFMVSARAMSVNPFFEGTARVQLDRGHRVIDAGPYRVVRHPGYVGLALLTASLPLLLGSAWSLVVALVTVCWLAVRTVLEDRMLHDELPGYPEYARRVRHRLVPGLW